MGSFKAEGCRRSRKVLPRTNVRGALAMAANAVGHGRGDIDTARGGDDLLQKRPFLVRVREDLELASMQFLSTKLEDFVASLQRCPPVRQLVKPDEQLVRVRLVARHGAGIMELDPRTLTMGHVLTCMQGFGELVAVFEKKPPPEVTVLSDVTGYPSTSSTSSDCASKQPQRVRSRRQQSPSSSSASSESSHPVPPS